MILKASQRGGAAQLGAHLLKAENEHVELHEISGFIADDVNGAMKEAQAVAQGTRCKQFLFSVSLNPPAKENVPVGTFEDAINRIEHRTGLTGQPRIIIFHEKEGRRHAHCIWSRIDAETMTAKPLSFFKNKLREVSKELYFEHGWQMPRGLIDSEERDPRNFSLAEWQQAKRMGRDPAQLKKTMQECWAASDSGAAFAAALERRGLYLARGDRRGHVAITYEGEAVSVARMVGKKAKEITAWLGDPAAARGIDHTRAHIASVIAPRLEALLKEADRSHQRDMEPLNARRLEMRDLHTVARRRLDDGQRVRSAAEVKMRNDRLRRGVAGLWDRLTGRRAETIRQNEDDAAKSLSRDRDERGALVADQLSARRALQREILAVRHVHAVRTMELHRDLAALRQAESREAEPMTGFNRAATPLRRTESSRKSSDRKHDRSHRGRGPDIGRC
jgi:hypothetical protein